jgi:hypothetical protein
MSCAETRDGDLGASCATAERSAVVGTESEHRRAQSSTRAWIQGTSRATGSWSIWRLPINAVSRPSAPAHNLIGAPQAADVGTAQAEVVAWYATTSCVRTLSPLFVALATLETGRFASKREASRWATMLLARITRGTTRRPNSDGRCRDNLSADAACRSVVLILTLSQLVAIADEFVPAASAGPRVSWGETHRSRSWEGEHV